MDSKYHDAPKTYKSISQIIAEYSRRYRVLGYEI
jgi:hypothetical protein